MTDSVTDRAGYDRRPMRLWKAFRSELGYFCASTIEHWAEWLATFCLAGCSGIIALSVEPRERVAFFDNFNERYPYSGETLGLRAVAVLIIVLPCAVIGSIALFSPRRIDLSLAGMSLAQALSLTLLVTEALKVTVARPRPNFFSYCGWDPQLKKCTGKASYRRDARLSFPSGHASNAFASGTWMTLFLCALAPRGVELWWILAKLVPIFVATFVAATRVTDYMHHVSDVVAGCVLGAGISVLVFAVQGTRVFIAGRKREDQLLSLSIDEAGDDL